MLHRNTPCSMRISLWLNLIDLIPDPRDALGSPKHFQDIEDARRRAAARKGCAQRLCDLAQLEAGRLRVAPDCRFAGRRGPIAQFFEHADDGPEGLPASGIE